MRVDDRTSAGWAFFANPPPNSPTSGCRDSELTANSGRRTLAETQAHTLIGRTGREHAGLAVSIREILSRQERSVMLR